MVTNSTILTIIPENIQTVKEMLEALLDSVPTLKEMEVGVNFSKKERAMDLSLNKFI